MRPPESWVSARVTLAIAGLTTLAWILAWAAGIENYAVVWAGFIPERIHGLAIAQPTAPLWLTPLTATLVHAGLIHITFNMLILLFCGRSVETILGRAGLIILYVAGAYAAALGQYLINIERAVPMVGASGAISAVLGAYATLFGRNRVRIANHRLAVWVNALWLAGAWIVLQLLSGFTFETIGAKLAIGAHIGGFLAGLVLARPLLLFRYRRA